MADRKAATIVDAARALVSRSLESIRPEDRGDLARLATSAYLTTDELQYIHDTLASYFGKIATLGFIYSELVVPPPGAPPGTIQAELPGSYPVDILPDACAGIVDAGGGRKFLTVSWGGRHQGTIIFRYNEKPKCLVEVASYSDRKEPEKAITCFLLSGLVDPGTPFDPIKKNMELWERRYWAECKKSNSSKLRRGKQRSRREGDACRDS